MTLKSEHVGYCVMEHGLRRLPSDRSRGREEACKRGCGKITGEPRGEPVSWAMWVATIIAEE